MADWTRITDLKDHEGEEVELRGWAWQMRSKGKIAFLVVRDGTGWCQCVAKADGPGEPFIETIENLVHEASIKVTGTVRLDDRAPGGAELGITGLEVVQNGEEFPIAMQSGHGVDFLLQNRHLWMRMQKPHATLRIRHTVIQATRDFLNSEGFLCMDAPIFTPNACEGTTTLFEVEYNDDEQAYLSQSGQLYNEAAAMAFGRVYCFGPTFRAEKSKTRRHLREFWMVEPEMAWATLDDVLDLGERHVAHVIARCLEDNAEDLEMLERDTAPLEACTKTPYPRLGYTEAVAWLKEQGHDFEEGGDFGAPDETALGERQDQPLWVTHYPAEVKAFYMHPWDEDPSFADCADLIAPEGYGEVIGGGRRADDLEYLERQIEKHELPPEAFDWYLDLRRHGSVPHAGYGLGIERTVAWICGTEHIRETIPFPRTLYRIHP